MSIGDHDDAMQRWLGGKGVEADATCTDRDCPFPKPHSLSAHRALSQPSGVPVSPADVRKLRPNVDSLVDAINAKLATPWSQVEQYRGRTIDISGTDIEVETALERFRGAGWYVTVCTDPRDQSRTWTFKLQIPTASCGYDR